MITNKISRIRIDGACEFKAQAAREQLKGIKIEMGAPYAYEQNGKAERVHRSLTYIARAMMIDSGLPEEFWVEALRYATYTRNRLPTKLYRGEIIDENDTIILPYGALIGTAPEL
jgi:transposase InsO family protein